jgi:muramoyltetrapeptide carboxypeptidase
MGEPAARPGVYLWCPAYPLPDATALLAASQVAQHFADALGQPLSRSLLLDRHPGPGAWLPAADRRADLTAGRAHTWLLAARGGYGCIELLAELDRPLPALIGYSDITALHAAQWVLGGPAGLYGFMPGVRHGERASASALALARGEGWAVESLPASLPLVNGTAEGPLFAACLAVLAGLAGTPWQPDLRGCLVALEDIDEKPYRVDRDLHQLAASGMLAGIAGLVFGRFPVDLSPNYAGPDLRTICERWAAQLNLPTVFGVPFGHDPDPVTLAQGRISRLTVHHDGWSLIQPAALPRNQ